MKNQEIKEILDICPQASKNKGDKIDYSKLIDSFDETLDTYYESVLESFKIIEKCHGGSIS